MNVIRLEQTLGTFVFPMKKVCLLELRHKQHSRVPAASITIRGILYNANSFHSHNASVKENYFARKYI